MRSVAPRRHTVIACRCRNSIAAAVEKWGAKCATYTTTDVLSRFDCTSAQRQICFHFVNRVKSESVDVVATGCWVQAATVTRLFITSGLLLWLDRVRSAWHVTVRSCSQKDWPTLSSKLQGTIGAFPIVLRPTGVDEVKPKVETRVSDTVFFSRCISPGLQRQS